MSEAVAPITAKDRVGELDVLRGFALLGVMTINLWEFGGESVTITADQLAALPNAALNSSIEFWLRLFVSDKANTLFACLFGMGFWIDDQGLFLSAPEFKDGSLDIDNAIPVSDWENFSELTEHHMSHLFHVVQMCTLKRDTQQIEYYAGVFGNA